MGKSYWRLHLLANEGQELLRAIGGIHPQARERWKVKAIKHDPSWKGEGHMGLDEVAAHSRHQKKGKK